MEVQGVAHLGADAPHTFEKDLASGRDDLRVALDLLDRLDEADVVQPATAVVERELLALGEVDAKALEAAAGHAREDALRGLRDRNVRDAPDGEVEDRLVVAAGSAERA